MENYMPRNEIDEIWGFLDSINTEELLKTIHSHSMCNKEELINAKKCGCFYCLKIFNPNEIKEWIKDKNGDTALCPYCTIDAIIPESDLYTLNNALLDKMNNYYF